MKLTAKSRMLALCGAAVLVGLAIASVEIAFGLGAVSTDGTVVALNESRGRRGRTRYAPIIHFNAGNRSVQFTGGSSNNFESYGVGEQVKVLYSRADPNKAVIDSFWQRYSLSAIFVICGTGVGILMLLWYKRE